VTARSAEHRTAEDAVHTRWSNPGAHKLRLAEFPATPQALPDALEGLVIHVFVARSRGFQIPAGVEGDRYLRRTERLLDTALERDGRALIEPRDVPNRLFGNCHDFALLAVSRLRESSVPARLRVGFATYLAPGHWEDHWVCQHWTGTQWATLDAQLGPKSRSGLGISFDVSDLSDREWRSAASTWRAVRAGEVDPRLCGVSFAGLPGVDRRQIRAA
jgi:hypothetical protein